MRVSLQPSTGKINSIQKTNNAANNTANNPSFKAVYYTKLFLSNGQADDTLKNLNWLIEKNPPEYLKEMVENSELIYSLSQKTDVFVSEAHIKMDPSQNDGYDLFGSIKIAFKDPDAPPHKKGVDEINIIAKGFTENFLIKKLKDSLEKLPFYE